MIDEVASERAGAHAQKGKIVRKRRTTRLLGLIPGTTGDTVSKHHTEKQPESMHSNDML